MTMNVHWAVTIASNHMNAVTLRDRFDVISHVLQRPQQHLRRLHRQRRPNAPMFIHNIIHNKASPNRTAADIMFGHIQHRTQDPLNMINATDNVMKDSTEITKELVQVFKS